MADAPRRRIRDRLIGLGMAGLAVVGFTARTQAVQIIGDQDTTTAASIVAEFPDFDYFDNVGRQSSGSGVYLGDGWAITVVHACGLSGGNPLPPQSLIIGGVTYGADLNVAPIRLTNADSSPTDLLLYKLNPHNDLLNLAPVNIASGIPTEETPIIMIGHGRDREDEVVGWTNTWDPAPSLPAATYRGFEWHTQNRSTRWGTNTITANHLTDPDILIYSDSYGTHYTFATTFEENAGDFEAHVAIGDSGGGVFLYENGQWVLAGIINGRLVYEGQPSNISVFNNHALAIDLSLYRDQIMAVIPEPNTLLLLVGLGPLLLRRRTAR